MKSRPDIDQTFMKLAHVWSERSTCSSRVSVGAVIVNELNQVIASGFNGSPRNTPHCDIDGCLFDSDGHCIRAIHAEENAILQCAVNGISPVGCSIYITHSPCLRCAQRIIQVGIVKVVWEVSYGKSFEPYLLLESQNIDMTHMVYKS